jgi:hypothetical protein
MSNDVARNSRTIQLTQQGVSFGANPPPRTDAAPTVPSTQPEDWRVSLKVPNELVNGGGEVLKPLTNTGNRMIFPFNPSIILGHTANYSHIHPTHSNYPFHAYKNSQVDNITITGEFYVENKEDAKYWVAVVHFLRTMTKMFYGESNPVGNPPLLSRLNGYGKHVLNDIPVVITNFTVDLPQDVDYISCIIDGKEDFVPAQSQIAVTCAPNYARRTVSRFNLNKFASGGYVGGPEGFV